MICETERLTLRELDHNDAPFILKLLNTPGWLEFIGDRGVKTIGDAEQYLLKGPIESYARNGFGLWAVQLRDSRTLIGMCGLLKRDTLEHPDIGFAFLPEFCGKGFGREAVNATITVVQSKYDLGILNAITTPSNKVSQKLLTGSGFVFEKVITNGPEQLNLYTKHLNPKDHQRNKPFRETF
jgi:[ribosomal protein S5]-alanine N-acetyltransferase